jgi:hypothetical protein
MQFLDRPAPLPALLIHAAHGITEHLGRNVLKGVVGMRVLVLLGLIDWLWPGEFRIEPNDPVRPQRAAGVASSRVSGAVRGQ